MKTIAYDSKYKQEILQLWNQELPADVINEERFLATVLLDENFSADYFRLYIKNNHVVGFIWAVYRQMPYGDRGLEQTRGWIVAMAVNKENQNQGLATCLVKEVEEQMIERKISAITLGAYSPNYLFPGVDVYAYASAVEFFKKMGYVVGSEAVSMERSLHNFHLENNYLNQRVELIAKGYHLTRFVLSDAEELLLFLKENFGGGWSKNVVEAIKMKRAFETILVLKNKEGTIVGYCQRAIDGNAERFGPFGVKKELRGLRLGMYLFNEMLDEMKKNQIYHVYFLWTGGSAQRFYERNGMLVYRTYRLMNKIIKER